MRAGKLRDVVDILTPTANTKSSGEVFYTYKAETGNRRVPCSVRNVTQKKGGALKSQYGDCNMGTEAD